MTNTPTLEIFTTGGTIDKVYFDALSEYQVGEGALAEILGQAGVTLAYQITPLLRKDSLELTDADRADIRDAVAGSAAGHILITHGTDTMVETAKVLAEKISDKVVILTGAMIPYKFGSSDGLFNLGSALAFVQTLPNGIYISMNGKYFNWNNVRKNKELGLFEELS